MGRYTLKVTIDGEDFTVKVPEGGILKDKVSLMAIDAFTIDSNPDFLIKEIDFDKAKLKGHTHFYISYKSDGKEKHLETIFEDAHGLKKHADKGIRQISKENHVFVDFISKTFLPLLSDRKFMRFLKENDLLTLKLEEWLDNYFYDDTYDCNFCYEKILEYASNYKQFRALVLGVELYKNNKDLTTKPVIEDEKKISEADLRPNYKRFVLNGITDDQDPDALFGLYTEEELEKFAKYLDSLPDEPHPHDDDEEFGSKTI